MIFRTILPDLSTTGGRIIIPLEPESGEEFPGEKSSPAIHELNLDLSTGFAGMRCKPGELQFA
jgi:hypothetical protein